MIEKNYKFSNVAEAHDYIEEFSGDWDEYAREYDYVNSNVSQTATVLSGILMLTCIIGLWSLSVAGIVALTVSVLWVCFIMNRVRAYPYTAEEFCLDESGYVFLSRKGVFVDLVRVYYRRVG